MSGTMIFWWTLFGLFILLIVFPISVYVITKCHFDAKNRSNYEFLNFYKKQTGGKNGKEEKNINERQG